MTPHFDAHNHLHDPRLGPFLEEIIPAMRLAGIERCVVNGTCEEDWPRVAELAERFPDLVQPSYGLHPWKIQSRSATWLNDLQRYLDRNEKAGIGECGLDRWIKNPDLASQREVFRAQLKLATERNLPLSVHCLQAWGPLLDCLRAQARPTRGFLLHSYGGSIELVRELVPLGALFSFSGHFLHQRKLKVRRAFRQMPPDRILVETDAPDMLLPDRLITIPLHDRDGNPLNHPANLPTIVTGLTDLLGGDAEATCLLIAENFKHFFG